MLVLFCVCLVVFLSSFKLGGFRASTSKRQVDFPVKSLVPDFKIVRVEVQGNVVRLSLRNDYDKAITAFSVSSSNIITRKELVASHRVIAPGATETDRYELPSLSEPNKGLIVLAAVFDDGTTAGEFKYINQILDARAGTQAQVNRILPILEDALPTRKNAGIPPQWQTLKLRIEQLPESEEGKSFEFQAALHDAKEIAIAKIKEIEDAQQNTGESRAQQILAFIVEEYKRRNAQIQGSLNQRQQR
jgi:hypothetical protein